MDSYTNPDSSFSTLSLTVMTTVTYGSLVGEKVK